MNKKIYAFKWKKTKYYFKNEKIEFIYNLLFLFLGSAIFYFVYIVLYAILQDTNI